jgi:hypothetical protein
VRFKGVIASTFLLTAFCIGSAFGKGNPPPAVEVKPGDLELEVAALAKLQEFDLTADQLKSLKQLAATVDAAMPPAQEKMSDAYRKALTDLRGALIDGDEEKIADAQDKVEDVRDEEDIDADPGLELTDSARKAAPDALLILTSNQVGSFLATHGSDVPDPVQTVVDAAEQIKEKPDTEFASIKKEACAQAALLVAGLDKTRQQPIVDKVAQWMDQAKAARKAPATADPPDFEKFAKAAFGKLDPMEVVRHWMQREMANLLANPELTSALTETLKNAE